MPLADPGRQAGRHGPCSRGHTQPVAGPRSPARATRKTRAAAANSGDSENPQAMQAISTGRLMPLARNPRHNDAS